MIVWLNGEENLLKKREEKKKLENKYWWFRVETVDRFDIRASTAFAVNPCFAQPVDMI